MPKPDEIYDPVARTLDSIGDRWSLVLIRLLLLAPQGFQELRKRTGIAPRVLSSRLKQLASQGFVESVPEGYRLTGRGRTLEPIVASIARWYTRHGFSALDDEPSQFTSTSPQSIIETLPFLLREDRAPDSQTTFEIRLTGEGGGVWAVHIDADGCKVEQGFAKRADVRYTADAKIWCGMALGIVDARDLFRKGLISKEGSREAMDEYFHQISHPGRVESDAVAEPTSNSTSKGDTQ